MFRLSKFETFGWKISVNVDVFMFCIMGLLMIYYNMEIFSFPYVNYLILILEILPNARLDQAPWSEAC